MRKKPLNEDNIIAEIIIGLAVVAVALVSSYRMGLTMRWYHYVGMAVAIGLLQMLYSHIIRLINQHNNKQ